MRRKAWLPMVFAALLLRGAATDFHAPIAGGVLAELNLARTDPQAYAGYLRKLRRSFRDRFTFVADGVAFHSREGVDAVDEALAYLMTVAPARPLKASRGLAQAARDHVRDQALRGGTGHTGSDLSDPVLRMRRYGQLEPHHFPVNSSNISAGEIIGYGRNAARDIVVMLIVDDDVPDRGHRKAIFDAKYTHAGIAFGPHPIYEWVCVIDLAGSFQEKSE